MENIYQKLLEVQKEIGVIKKDGKNPHFKSTYATLPGILSEVKPVLNKHDLVLLQPVLGNKVVTTIQDVASKEEVHADIDLPANLNPQQMGSAITYYRRYLLAGLLSLELDDDDGNGASQPAKSTPANVPATNGKANGSPKTLPELKPGTPTYAAAVKWMNEGGSIDKVKLTYSISKEVEEMLLNPVQ